MQLRITSSLEKVFWDDHVADHAALTRASFLRGERLSFEAVYAAEAGASLHGAVSYEIISPIKELCAVSRVLPVPVTMPVTDERDDNVLRTAPGLYPDVLLPWREGESMPLAAGQTYALWIDVTAGEDTPGGEYPVTVRLTDGRGERAEATVTLTVIPAALPPQTLVYTEWFYPDCLQDYYRLTPFSEDYWRVIENFLRTARRGGVNMILTPIITPELDTAAGLYRSPTQLLDIDARGGAYAFRFDRLKRWIDTCRRVGIDRFEMAHLFTQWGAASAPQVYAMTDAGEGRIFGWDTPALDPEYIRFLRAMLPELVKFLKTEGIDAEHCGFHISDEPSEGCLKQYIAAREAIADCLGDYPIMDAMSEYAFYESGAMDRLIPATGRIQPFLDNHVPNLWTYYCCSGRVNVSNRFIAMPSWRNRVIGMQMYRWDIKGFLHWGYNFYNCGLSRYPVQPFLINDGDGMSEAGDQFSVYPARDGTALESLRFVVFAQALQDMRAFTLCERLCGAEAVRRLIDSRGEMTFEATFPDAQFILDVREAVNRMIADAMKKEMA